MTSSYQFLATVNKFENKLWEYHFSVPQEVGEEISKIHASRRIICKVNNLPTWHAPILKENGHFFILLNQERRSAAGLLNGDSCEVSLELDHSEFGFDLPKELEMVWAENPLTEQYFKKLTPGKQRNLIYIVDKVKSTGSRMKKALAIAYHLEEEKGLLDFKKLNETIKLFNKKAL